MGTYRRTETKYDMLLDYLPIVYIELNGKKEVQAVYLNVNQLSARAKHILFFVSKPTLFRQGSALALLSESLPEAVTQLSIAG